MDKHYLTPLFSPRSIVVFAGDIDQPELQSPQAQLVAEHLQASEFQGKVSYLDIRMQGTLGDLAQSRADLAIIALPNEELLSALEVAGRIQCKAALIVSHGVDAALAAQLHAVAREHQMSLLGPNCIGFQRPKEKLNASALGKLAREGSLALVSQSGAMTTSILDWAGKNGVGFSSVVSLGANTAVGIAQVLDFGRRSSHAKYHCLSGRHTQCTALHEFIACRRKCQASYRFESRA